MITIRPEYMAAKNGSVKLNELNHDFCFIEKFHSKPFSRPINILIKII